MILQGKAAWVFPDSFDVDYIIGIPNIGLTDLKQITACLMKDFDPEFLDSCAPGDMLIAGKSFGYGHAHPQPMALRRCGILSVPILPQRTGLRHDALHLPGDYRLRAARR